MVFQEIQDLVKLLVMVNITSFTSVACAVSVDEEIAEHTVEMRWVVDDHKVLCNKYKELIESLPAETSCYRSNYEYIDGVEVPEIRPAGPEKLLSDVKVVAKGKYRNVRTSKAERDEYIKSYEANVSKYYKDNGLSFFEVFLDIIPGGGLERVVVSNPRDENIIPCNTPRGSYNAVYYLDNSNYPNNSKLYNIYDTTIATGNIFLYGDKKYVDLWSKDRMSSNKSNHIVGLYTLVFNTDNDTLNDYYSLYQRERVCELYVSYH